MLAKWSDRPPRLRRLTDLLTMFSLASLGAPTLSTTPSGAYSGSKSVLSSVKVIVNISLNDGSTMDVHLDAGDDIWTLVTIDCKALKYAYDLSLIHI